MHILSQILVYFLIVVGLVVIIQDIIALTERDMDGETESILDQTMVTPSSTYNALLLFRLALYMVFQYILERLTEDEDPLSEFEEGLNRDTSLETELKENFPELYEEESPEVETELTLDPGPLDEELNNLEFDPKAVEPIDIQEILKAAEDNEGPDPLIGP